MKINYHFDMDILPLYKALLGFNYTAGTCVDADNPEEDSPCYFEEWSIGLILIQFTLTRYKM